MAEPSGNMDDVLVQTTGNETMPDDISKIKQEPHVGNSIDAPVRCHQGELDISLPQNVHRNKRQVIMLSDTKQDGYLSMNADYSNVQIKKLDVQLSEDVQNTDFRKQTELASIVFPSIKQEPYTEEGAWRKNESFYNYPQLKMNSSYKAINEPEKLGEKTNRHIIKPEHGITGNMVNSCSEINMDVNDTSKNVIHSFCENKVGIQSNVMARSYGDKVATSTYQETCSSDNVEGKHRSDQDMSLIMECENVKTESSLDNISCYESDTAYNAQGIKYQCETCGKGFSHASLLQIHVTSTHWGVAPFECQLCQKDFTTGDNLLIHMVKIHSSDKPFQCKSCRKRFSHRDSLYRHVSSAHSGVQTYECNICGKKFDANGNLMQHMKRHTGNKPFECEACGKRFASSSTLHTHVKIHTGIKPFECEFCGKKFGRSAHLQTHVRTHTGGKPFKSELDGKKLSVSSNLRKHAVIHTGDKSFECKICGKKFSRNSTLQCHVRRHMGIKPFECAICGKKFAQKNALQIHARTHRIETM